MPGKRGRQARSSSPARPPLLPGLEDADPLTRLCAPAGWNVAGVDEVGRGCLAGPVVACAVSLPEGFALEGLTDSKKLTAARRELLAPLIRQQALSWGLGWVLPARIDEINILQATFEAMGRAILAMGLRRLRQQTGRAARTLSCDCLPRMVLVDGNRTIPDAVLERVFLAPLAPDPGTGAACRLPMRDGQLLFRQHCLVGGDSLAPAISAASVLAKTWRDRLMTRLARDYPGYGFEVHKGYGTKAHFEALHRLGPSPLHRRSFRGVLEDEGSLQAVAGQDTLC